MTDWMPPLPEPDGYMRHTPVWAEDSMRQLQADAARAALEQAARVCADATALLDKLKMYSEADETRACAVDIMALAREVTP